MKATKITEERKSKPQSNLEEIKESEKIEGTSDQVKQGDDQAHSEDVMGGSQGHPEEQEFEEAELVMPEEIEDAGANAVLS